MRRNVFVMLGILAVAFVVFCIVTQNGAEKPGIPVESLDIVPSTIRHSDWLDTFEDGSRKKQMRTRTTADRDKAAEVHRTLKKMNDDVEVETVPAEMAPEIPYEEQMRDKAWHDQQVKKEEAEYTFLFKSHEHEKRDVIWADSAESELENILTNLIASRAGISILENSCKSTMCRVDVVYDSEGLGKEIARNIRSTAFPSGTVRLFEENGKYRSVSYLAREGETLGL